MRNSFLFGAGLLCALAVSALVASRKPAHGEPAGSPGRDRWRVSRGYQPAAELRQAAAAARVQFVAQDFYDR